jgi:hypothetical protein
LQITNEVIVLNLKSSGMSRSLGNDIRVILRGVQLVSREAWKLQEKEVRDIWENSSVKALVAECTKEVNKSAQAGPANVEDITVSS